MTKRRSLFFCMAMLLILTAVFRFPQNAEAAEASSKPMYRLYNPNSGEHFYTASEGEKNNVVAAGWNYEGIGWYAPASSETPVYRVYNPNSGDHHYTMSKGERDHLVSLGWRDEGIGWYSDDSKGVALYRQYNPNALTGNHNYTTSKGENDWLVSLGWQAEGIGWYGVDKNAPAPTATPKPTATPTPKPAVKLSYEEDGAYAVIEAKLTLKGTGTGYHGKIDISSSTGTGTVSFGVQYEENMSKHEEVGQTTDNNTIFLMENVMSHATEAGPQGKKYNYIKKAEVGKEYLLRMSYTKADKVIHCYVNDEEIFSQVTTMEPPFIFAVEGSCAHNGDTIDALFTGVRVKCGDGKQSYGEKFSDYGTIGEWNDTNDYFGLDGEVVKEGVSIETFGPEQTLYTRDGETIAQLFHSYKADIRVTGTAKIDPAYDWDTCFQIEEPNTRTTGHPLSAIINIAQQQ